MAKALESGKVKKYITDFPNPKDCEKMKKHYFDSSSGSIPPEESEDKCAYYGGKDA
jgi:hypothetical protein